MRFSYLFSPELHERLVWFGKLRWFAVCGLAVASLIGPPVGLPDIWPALFVVAVFVAAYNLLFTLGLRRRDGQTYPYERLRSVAMLEILLDLLALLVVVHFTGGLQSPLLCLFCLHMAIGTIMLSTEVMYLMATGTSIGLVGLYLLEAKGVLSYHPLDAVRGICELTCDINVVTSVAVVFSIVYLTDSVTSKFKQRNIELYETTEQLRTRTAELQRALRRMEIVEQRKSHYMRISAHQLRSPLATIKTSLQVVTDGYVELSSERGRKLVAGAVERVDGLIAIVNDLLDLAKMREGRTSAPWSRKVNVNQLLADLFDTLEPLADERDVKLVPDFQGVAILDWGIPPDLVYAFENLIENAIKYSLPGGDVVVHHRVMGDMVTVEVEDHGIGIPQDFLDEVLLEFVRAPNARKHAPQGTGLGLAIAAEGIEAHGGTMAVRSREGQGTTVTVSLPLHSRPVTGTGEPIPGSEDPETSSVTQS